jgi:hypothetical protein
MQTNHDKIEQNEGEHDLPQAHGQGLHLQAQAQAQLRQIHAPTHKFQFMSQTI